MTMPGSVLLCWISLLSVIPQGTVPPLPKPAFESFPPATREAIARSYKEAAAHPNDGEAVGALARLLQAWEQWEAAHEAYVRAQSLAPRTFAWHYLDAIVLERLAQHTEAAARLEQALRIAPGDLPARVKLAEALLESGNLDRSRQLFEVLRRVPESEAAAELGLGRIAAAEGHHE